MVEKWKEIPGYEGFYEVSNLGEVRSVNREVIYSNGRKQTYNGKILKQKIAKDNRLQVCLSKNNKSKYYTVHKLVALTFLGERTEGYEILHANGNCVDNNLNNLSYGTKKENQIDQYRQGKKSNSGKLTIEQVMEARELYKTGNYTQTKLAKMFGICSSGMRRILKREYFSWLNDDGTIEKRGS